MKRVKMDREKGRVRREAIEKKKRLKMVRVA